MIREPRYHDFSVNLKVKIICQNQNIRYKCKRKNVINFSDLTFFVHNPSYLKFYKYSFLNLSFGIKPQFRHLSVENITKFKPFKEIIITNFNSRAGYVSELGYTCPNQGTLTLVLVLAVCRTYPMGRIQSASTQSGTSHKFQILYISINFLFQFENFEYSTISNEGFKWFISSVLTRCAN